VPENGGFPDPPAGGVVRVVRAEHHACGRETRVRLPAHVSPIVVRRVICRGCAETFEAPAVEEIEVLSPEVGPGPRAPLAEVIPMAPHATAAEAATMAPAKPRRARGLRLPAPPKLPSAPSLPSMPRLPSAPAWLRDPDSRAWRLATIPVAAIAVIAGLLLLQGGGSDETDTPFAGSAPVVEKPSGGEGSGGGAGKPASASFVRESSFSLALPAGWERTPPADGATFAAATDGGDADATLWVERDPGLSFAEFEASSLDTLKGLAGSARVVERVAAPTADGTIVHLAADAPAGSPQYEVTLRAGGPYRYYLATTVQPDASDRAADGAELIHGSFQPISPNAEGK
jgi:hypothetical protein